MQVHNAFLSQIKQAIEVSSVTQPLIYLIELIREYSVFIFSLIVSGINMSPFRYMFSLAGPKKMISATVSVSLERLAQMFPFEMWIPEIQISATFKLKKVGAIVITD